MIKAQSMSSTRGEILGAMGGLPEHKFFRKLQAKFNEKLQVPNYHLENFYDFIEFLMKYYRIKNFTCLSGW